MQKGFRINVANLVVGEIETAEAHKACKYIYVKKYMFFVVVVFCNNV